MAESIAGRAGAAPAAGGQAAESDAVRRRRIVFRAWHRGIREMDLLLGRYVSAHIAVMNAAELDALERLMAHEDADLLRCFTGEAELPASIDRRLFAAILAGAATAG